MVLLIIINFKSLLCVSAIILGASLKTPVHNGTHGPWPMATIHLLVGIVFYKIVRHVASTHGDQWDNCGPLCTERFR